MAQRRTYTIERFLGVNESPDGDTGLNLGESPVMRNFRITPEGNLQIRPGYDAVVTLADGHTVRGMWHGYVDGTERWLAACNGHVWSIDLTTKAATDLGAFADAPTHFFPFSDKVYMMNGTQYYSWDGTTFATVAGYVPIITIAAVPSTGAGTSNEQVNKLTASKWIWFSSTASCTVYHLPETAITSVDKVLLNDVEKTVTTHYTVNLSAGTVTFLSENSEGTNDVKIKYTKTTDAQTANRTLVLSQRFSETYNGATDNRVFLYGDGTNKAYYSGIEYSTGNPTAEYFPDLNVLDVGEDNTPITSMIRQFNKLMTFKTDGTYITDYDYLTLSDGTVTAGFYTRAIEKDIGNTPMGQVKLVNNYPISLNGNSAYRWGLIYSSGTQDERAAKRISDKVRETLGGMTLSSAITFDDEWNREFWILQNETACVYQYANEAQGDTSYKQNVWYVYTAIPATCFVSINGELYFGSDDGYIMHMSRDYHSDNGTAIDAYWESGSMAFDANYMRKNLSEFWTSLKPESGARITATFESDRKLDFDDKIISRTTLNFNHASFANWSFSVNTKPRVKRTKLKAKKFVYLKLIFSSNSASATATILNCTLPVTYAGKAK